jgi:FtsH-binding integral membrane protein
MSDAAVSIIREFIGRSDPRLRENACVGLSSVGGAEALELLVAMATDDHEESVRQCAMRELATLPDEQIVPAQDLITKKLLLPAGTSRVYSTAAALMIAKDVQFDSIPFTTSLRYTWKATALKAKGEKFRQLWRTTALLGAGVLVGWIILGSMCGLTGTRPWIFEDYPTDLVVCSQVLAMVILSLLLSLRDIHWNSQARVRYAASLELGLTFAVSLVADVCVLAFFLGLHQDSDTHDWVVRTIRLVLLIPASLLFIRFVTLSLLRQTTRRIGSVILRILIGWWIGTFVLLLASRFMGSDTVDRMYSPIFAAGIPLILGSTFVYAYRDRNYAARSSALGNPLRWATWVFVALSITSIMYLTLHRRSKPPVESHDQLVVVNDLKYRELATYSGTNPIIVHVNADNTVITASMMGSDYRLSMTGPRRLASYDVDNPKVRLTANKGDVLTIVETKVADSESISLLSWLQDILPARRVSAQTAPAKGPVELDLSFEQEEK